MSTIATSQADFSAKFRPASLSDFKDYAKNLAWLTGLPRQQSQETLARIYGYADLHELQAALKSPGKPGPFQDELEPELDFRAEVPARFASQANRVATLVRDALPDLPRHQGYRQELAPLLGLFTSPAEHRLCVSLVQKQVRTAAYLGWSPSSTDLFAQYDFPWRVPKSAFESFRIAPRYTPDERLPDTHFVPQMQLDSLLDHQLFWYPDAYDFLKAPPHRLAKAVRAYISAWLHETDFQDDVSFSSRFVDRMCSCWVEFILDHSQKASAEVNRIARIDWDPANTQDALKELDQGWERQGVLGKFLLTRDESLINEHPILASLDNPVALAQVFVFEYQRLRRQSCRDLYVDLSLATTTLYVNAPAPAELSAGVGARLVLMVHARTDSRTDTGINRPLTFWNYSATLGLVHPESRTFRPVALVKGLNIAPFRVGPKGKLVMASTEAFLDQMDAHSQDSLHVAETLVQELIPGLGWSDIEAFAASSPEGRQGFLTFRLEVLPEHRGKGLSAIALSMLTQAFSQYPETEWNDIRSRRMPLSVSEPHGPFVLGKPAFLVGAIPAADTKAVKHLAAHLEGLGELVGIPVVTVALDFEEAS